MAQRTPHPSPLRRTATLSRSTLSRRLRPPRSLRCPSPNPDGRLPLQALGGTGTKSPAPRSIRNTLYPAPTPLPTPEGTTTIGRTSTLPSLTRSCAGKLQLSAVEEIARSAWPLARTLRATRPALRSLLYGPLVTVTTSSVGVHTAVSADVPQPPPSPRLT